MADLGGFRRFRQNWAAPTVVLRSTDDRLNGTLLSDYRTKKTAAMTHLSMFLQKIRSKSIDETG